MCAKRFIAKISPATAGQFCLKILLSAQLFNGLPPFLGKAMSIGKNTTVARKHMNQSAI
jgi:hypothetical protein